MRTDLTAQTPTCRMKMHKVDTLRRALTTATNLMMILYWCLAGALALDLVAIDPALMYSDFENPRVVAWNWSFFPIDMAFAILGLIAVFGSLSALTALKFEIVSAVLMMCAGVMAISYWLLTAEFDPSWWGVNIWLIVMGGWNLSKTTAAPTAQSVAFPKET